ncbi:hypothetical protein ACHAXT_009579 [Thalassiosira profunda]
MCNSPTRAPRLRQRPESPPTKPLVSAAPTRDGSTTAKGGAKVVRLTLASACFLLLGLASSAYLAFLAGCRCRCRSRVALLKLWTPMEEELQPAVPAKPTQAEGDARLPSGQQLHFDVRFAIHNNVLRTEEQLVAAMLTLADEHGLSMLSYHCHSRLDAEGSILTTSCMAALLDGHLALHAMPHAGAMHFDLFSKTKDLMQVLPTVERLFASPNNGLNISSEASEHSDSRPEVRWSHSLRGFRQGFAHYQRDKSPHDQEFGEDVLRRRDFEHKRPLASLATKFQRMDVVELVHKKGTAYAGLGMQPMHAPAESPVGPDRALFIDGVLQSSLYGEAAYHESLVHPAMLSHPHPRRVSIIGGGEGATLREVLKHSTVEEAVMIEIDGELANASRTYLPEWSDCSDMLGSDADSCFDDSRASVRYEDAFGYFLEHFGDDDDDEEQDSADYEEPFDAIVMDALDPDDFGPFVDKLYNDTAFVESLYDGLTEKGLLVVQVGSVPYLSDPPDDMSAFYNRAALLHRLEDVGFERIHTYDEGHCHFYSPWQFLVAFKDAASGVAGCRRNAAEVELELKRRLLGTRSGERALKYVDGSTLVGYQTPPKVVETHYCRKENAEECQTPELGKDALGQCEIISRVEDVPAFDPFDDRHRRINRCPATLL